MAGFGEVPLSALAPRDAIDSKFMIEPACALSQLEILIGLSRRLVKTVTKSDTWTRKLRCYKALAGMPSKGEENGEHEGSGDWSRLFA